MLYSKGEIKMRPIPLLVKIFLIGAIFLLGATGGYFYNQKVKLADKVATERKKETHLAFLLEVYEKIQENYWEKMTEEQLTNLFLLGAEKLTNQPQTLRKKDKASLEELLSKITKQQENKKEFATQLADIVLANLKPFGRSRLYTQKEEKELKERVENINPEVNQYEVLGVGKEASFKEIQKIYQEKVKELSPQAQKSPEVNQKLAQIQRAFKILSDPEARKIYDQLGVEPTIEARLIRPDIFYLKIKKFSPTTFEELKKATEKVDNLPGLDSLILDLQNNIGGAIDGLPYFLGPFIGNDQYAYQFFHQGEKVDFKTKVGWLPSLLRYKKVVILINGETQSSAEVMAAVLKKYNVGLLVGTPSKGWGTVEKVFLLESQIEPEKKYSIFLAHSLALRDDGQPIEGRGVEPMINITQADWEQQLYAYFRYPELAKVIKEIGK